MAILVLTMIGAMLGWLAVIARNLSNHRQTLAFVIGGAAGALASAVLAHQLLGASDVLAGRVGIGALLAAVTGSIVAILLINMVRIGTAR